MDNLPPELTGDLRDRIHAELLRIDAARRSRSAPRPKLAECLETAYDVFAGELLRHGRQLTGPVLTESIPAWVFLWAWGPWLGTTRSVPRWPGYFTMGDSPDWWRRDGHLVCEAGGSSPFFVLSQNQTFKPPSKTELKTGVRKTLEGRAVYWQAKALTATLQKRATPEADQRADITGRVAVIEGKAPRAAVKQARYPARAAWLRARLAERKWNKHDLARHGGPDHKTTQKVLDGFAVQDGVLEKIAQGLSGRGAKVSLTEIPQK
jgi:hypothetical protein